MTGLRSTVGLISGLNTKQIVDSLISLQRTPAVRLENRVQGFQQIQTALKTLEAKLLTLTTAVQDFGKESNFTAVKTTNSNSASLLVTTTADAVPDNYQFQAVRKAVTHQVRSKGYANADQASIGTGTLVIAQGGQLNKPTTLDALNGGDGVQRGKIRITDRSGTTAEIDLSSAFTLDDVVSAINNNTALKVTAAVDGDHFVLTDTSGSVSSNLIVAELNGGSTAAGLGLLGSVAANGITGSSVYYLSGDFGLSQINDGNAPKFFSGTGAADIRITLSDDSVIEVDLDGAKTLNEVIGRINDHEDNGGKVAASLNNGRLVLEDTSGGGGSSAFAIQDINGAYAVESLGLNKAAAGDEITGHRLLAGANSVLLRTLRGGAGIGTLGAITLTDRTGTSATLDLSGAETLDDVLRAINAAESDAQVKLQLTARVNSLGTGIEIVDTSGQTASNLIIADAGGGTLAADLGIAANAAANSVNSGGLHARHANESTLLTRYKPQKGQVATGSFRIIDSAGNQALINISNSVKTIGDVLQRINSATGIQVTAKLNETGDGFEIVDEAGGGGTLQVQTVSGTTAEDLRLLNGSAIGGDGKQRVSSRLSTVINVEAGDTLNSLVEKINATQGPATAKVTNDGSAFNAYRLELTAAKSGAAQRLVIDDGGIGLNFSTLFTGQDALLRVGSDAETGFLRSSSSNTFANVAPGLTIDIFATSTTVTNIAISRDTSRTQSAIERFVQGYNDYLTAAADLTRYNPETEERGVLQGQGVVLRVQNRLQSLATRQFLDSSSGVRSLQDLGIRLGSGSKLVINGSILSQKLQDDPNAVREFFLNADKGFAKLADATVKSFTDTVNGTFAVETKSLQNTVDSYLTRVEQLDALLAVKRTRLEQQFVNLENVLSQISSQQNAISSIGSLSVPRIGKGILS